MDKKTLREVLTLLQAKQAELTESIGVIKAEIQRLETQGGASNLVEKKIQIQPPSPSLLVAPAKTGRPRKFKTCTMPGCKKVHVAKGLCASHYSLQRRAAGVAQATASQAQADSAENKDLS